MTYCVISHQECEDFENCFDCLEWLCTCDQCGDPGHVDSDGWEGLEEGEGAMRVFCGLTCKEKYVVNSKEG